MKNSTVYCENLKSRKLISLQGKDSLPFLQGMITNDTRHLANDPHGSVSIPCMYSMMLNNIGRVLYDLIVYKSYPHSDEDFLIECDEQARPEILKLFTIYKLRKDIRLQPCEDTSVWVVFHKQCGDVEGPVPPASSIDVEGDFKVNVRDPRLHLLGQRVLLDTKADLLCKNPDFKNGVSEGRSWYTQLRYQLGVSEGLKELPPGNCFPIECNADYMSGVSFHKGCYIGQELTARTHHTGVVRKRVMPIMFLDHVPGDLPCDAPVKDADGHTVGKFRARQGQSGLALLKVEEALKASMLTVNSLQLSTVKPGWWPKELPKRHLESQHS